jgi:hypothetical protein
MMDVQITQTINIDDLAEQLATDFDKAVALIKAIDKAAQTSDFTMMLAKYFVREVVEIYEDDEPVTLEELLKDDTDITATTQAG